MAMSQGLLDFWSWVGNFYAIQLHSGIHGNHLWIKSFMTTAPMILMTIQFYIFDGSFELCQLGGIDGILWMFFHAVCEERSRHSMMSGCMYSHKLLADWYNDICICITFSWKSKNAVWSAVGSNLFEGWFGKYRSVVPCDPLCSTLEVKKHETKHERR